MIECHAAQPASYSTDMAHQHKKTWHRMHFLLRQFQKRLLFDLRLEEHLGLIVIESLIYGGSSPWIALKTKINILNWIRGRTGSQWRSWSACVTWEYLRMFIASLAAAFWIRCNLTICDLDKPFRGPLQKSKRPVINARLSSNKLKNHGIN